jgi:hypothetical protein
VVLKTDGPLSPVYEEEEVEKLSSEIVSWFSEKVRLHPFSPLLPLALHSQRQENSSPAMPLRLGSGRIA